MAMDLYPHLKSFSSAHHGYRGGGGGDTPALPPVKEIVMLNIIVGVSKGAANKILLPHPPLLSASRPGALSTSYLISAS